MFNKHPTIPMFLQIMSYFISQEILSSPEGHEIVRTSVGLCQQPNCLEWAQLFVEGLICVERFVSLFEICETSTHLVYTIIGNIMIEGVYIT